VDSQSTLADGDRGERALRELLDTEGPSDRAILLFRRIVLDHYRESGRRMPWRETTDPYRVLVSEVMLQQTQVDRVRPKYAGFLEAFPDPAALARAQAADVLRAWQGLGYNRRALALQRAAARIVTEFGGRVPDDPDVLETLPGIGPATAAAIAVYAFGRPVAFIETNVRRVFLHFFFRGISGVTDAEIRPLVERALDRERPREWYWALMDYGTLLARTVPNPNRRSAHHAVQSRFEGSARQLRGRVLRALVEAGPLSSAELASRTGADPARLTEILGKLRSEGFVAEEGPEAPRLALYPEDRCGVINASRLADGADAKTADARLAKELWRTVAFIAGGVNSDEPCVVKTVLSSADLDTLPASTFSPNVAGKISQAAKRLGLARIERTSYRAACLQGWAPPPTNAAQKAIWESVNPR